MALVDELARLDELRARGALSDEEFGRAKARLLDGDAGAGAGAGMSAGQRLRRSRGDRWIGGVCGGVAALSGIESWIWRLLLVALALFAGGGVLLYILLWIFVPEEGA